MGKHVKHLGWCVLLAILAAACAPASTEVSTQPPTDLQPQFTVTTTPPDLTPTIPPTEPPTLAPTETATETTAPSPTQTSANLAAIQHFNPGEPVNIVAIDMLDEQNGWAQGTLDDGTEHLLRSDDGGNTWMDVTPPVAPPEDSVTLKTAAYFQDRDQAWAFFSRSDGMTPAQAAVWHTQDGGVTWQISQPLDLQGQDGQFFVSDIQFIDENNGWLLSHVGVGMNHDYVMLYRTQDGGATWQRLIDPMTDGSIQACYKPGMQFADAQRGWLAVNCNGVMPGAIVYHTRDGGATWETLSLPAPSDNPTLFENPAAVCGVEQVIFFTPDHGKLSLTCANYDTDPLTYLYFLYTTQDGGASWTAAPYPGGRLTFLNDQTGWVQNVDIYQTKDGGVSWTKIAIVSWEADFDFVNERQGWAVAKSGDETALVKSEDGGVYWSEVQPLIQ